MKSPKIVHFFEKYNSEKCDSINWEYREIKDQGKMLIDGTNMDISLKLHGLGNYGVKKHMD